MHPLQGTDRIRIGRCPNVLYSDSGFTDRILNVRSGSVAFAWAVFEYIDWLYRIYDNIAIIRQLLQGTALRRRKFKVHTLYREEGSMRRLAWVFAAMLFASCGGGGGGGGGHTPEISNLQFSPASAIVNDGGGTVAISGSFDFTDAGGDLARIVLTTYDNNHIQIGSIAIPASIPGVTSGKLYGTVTIDTSVAGVFTFTVLVYDSAGNASDPITGTFPVTPDPWQSRSNPLSPGTKITSVAYGGGLFLAGAGDNRILGSADGTTWFIANAGIGKTIRRIVYGNGHFVAIAEDPASDFLIASADNGATWATASPTFGKDTWRDVSSGNGIFFATQEYSDSLYASLDNGATWSLVSSGMTASGMDAPAYGNGKFVAAVNGGNLLVSGDGFGWSLGSPYGGYYRPYIASDNGVFAILPFLGDVYVSHDGASTWQNRFTIPTYWMMWDLAAGDGVFVGVGRIDSLSQQGGVLCASYGGDVWVSRTLGNSFLWGIAYGNGTFVAVGDNATIYQSAPGWKP